MSNEIKVDDKVRVRKDAPIIYYYSSNGIVKEVEDEAALVTGEITGISN